MGAALLLTYPLTPALAEPASAPFVPLQQCSPGLQLNAQGLPDMDCGSLDILIRHDRYTLSLLEQVLSQVSRPEIRKQIQRMIQKHAAEVEKLNSLRRDLYGQPLK